MFEILRNIKEIYNMYPFQSQLTIFICFIFVMFIVIKWSLVFAKADIKTRFKLTMYMQILYILLWVLGYLNTVKLIEKFQFEELFITLCFFVMYFIGIVFSFLNSILLIMIILYYLLELKIKNTKNQENS